MEEFLKLYQGLDDRQVQLARKAFGRNRTARKRGHAAWRIFVGIVAEPMFLLLLIACSIYFILGEYAEGGIMFAAILLVSGISLFQEYRSHNAMASLRKLTDPHARLIRNGQITEVPVEEIVPGDLMVVEEGNLIPADGENLRGNDFAVNESILSGESFPVSKESGEQIYQGTTVTGGLAVARVVAIGDQTQLGKLGKSIEGIQTDKTPLQLQISAFVKGMAIAGALAFLLVWLLNYLRSEDVLGSLLHGLTLAMSILPEEIPVAFATFMAIGAWRMIRHNVLAKEPQTVESLGSATVICIDKTGTITENRMALARIYDADSGETESFSEHLSPGASRIATLAMWASEPIPFDPMEVALHEAYAQIAPRDERKGAKMVKEYPLSGRPPMMTHVQETVSGKRIIAAKGGVEAILACCRADETLSQSVMEKLRSLAAGGFRVLGVAEALLSGNDFPIRQEDFSWQFAGLIALNDPPKANISAVFEQFYKAGVQVKIITGDYPETATAIAKQTGFRFDGTYLRGEEVMQMDEDELQGKVKEIQLFARMFPEAKLRVVEALKSCGEVVAMTGDGVNDGPALKAAHIGIAMGKRGTELAQRVASLVLVDDDLSNMVSAIALGRRIYTNLKKAIQYIISIHIPIILTVTLPLLLGWRFPNIFSPVHVIFLELIMGPTCSIIFENEPMEANLMHEKPRKMSSTFLSLRELSLSIIQGLVITAGVLGMYLFAVSQGSDEATTRTLVFSTLIFSNIFLTLVNRSFVFGLATTLRYRNRLIPLIILITLAILCLILLIPAVRELFDFARVSLLWIAISIGFAFLSVIWVEVYKWIKGRQLRKSLSGTVLVPLLLFGLVLACSPHPKQQTEADLIVSPDSSRKTYGFGEPDTVFYLPHELRELSGLSVQPGGTLAGVQDEKGKIFLIDPETANVTSEIKFAGDGDYEGLTFVSDTPWVLRSDGTLFEVRDFGLPSQETIKHKGFPGGGCDAEGLVWDRSALRLLVSCKGSVEGNVDFEGTKVVFSFDPESGLWSPDPAFLIDLEQIRDILGRDPVKKAYEKFARFFEGDGGKLTFRPSGMAIHPLSRDIYILSSAGKLLLILDPEGNFVDLESLPGPAFRKPEAIAFLSDGTLVIGNEADGARANLVVFKPVQKTN